MIIVDTQVLDKWDPFRLDVKKSRMILHLCSFNVVIGLFDACVASAEGSCCGTLFITELIHFYRIHLALNCAVLFPLCMVASVFPPHVGTAVWSGCWWDTVLLKTPVGCRESSSLNCNLHFLISAVYFLHSALSIFGLELSGTPPCVVFK